MKIRKRNSSVSVGGWGGRGDKCIPGILLPAWLLGGLEISSDVCGRVGGKKPLQPDQRMRTDLIYGARRKRYEGLSGGWFNPQCPEYEQKYSILPIWILFSDSDLVKTAYKRL
jgi:hypothetical protein